MPEPKPLIDVAVFKVEPAAAKLKPAATNFPAGHTNGGKPQHSRFCIS
jgi:hypothetical protein